MTLPSPTFAPQRPNIADHQLDIRQFGAIPDGSTHNTHAIAAAMDACVQSGGGRVVIPPGVWLTGPIHLQSGIDLHLSKGAELRFSPTCDHYLPAVLSVRGGVRCMNYSPFIYANGCCDIAITGKGVCNGQGEYWWPWKKAQPGMITLMQMGAEQVPVEQRVFATEAHGVRPPFVQPLNCQRVLIEGVTFINSPSWTINPAWCDDLTIAHVSINNPANAPNTDGINPEGCANVLIEHCHVDTGDDAICIKSGRDQDGWSVGRPCRNILIRHCTVLAGHGGVVIGSEISGGVQNLHAHDCVFDGTDVGIRIKSKPGRGGVLENLNFHHITMQGIRQQAILITQHYGGGGKIDQVVASTDRITRIRDIRFTDIQCKSARIAWHLLGLPDHPLTDITMERVHIRAEQPMICEHVESLHVHDLSLEIEPHTPNTKAT